MKAMVEVVDVIEELRDRFLRPSRGGNDVIIQRPGTLYEAAR